MALLESEKTKLEALIQQSKAGDAELMNIYEELIADQQKLIAHLEENVQQLTDRLEGPALRNRLKKVESAFKDAAAESLVLKREVVQLEAEAKRQEAQLKSLLTQFKNLKELNESYVRQIAFLSLHERQNEEDHASTVLTISNHLSELGLNIPAKASVKLLNLADGTSEGDDLGSDPHIDQTIFSSSFRSGSKRYTLSLVVNSITADLKSQPIELKLMELDERDRTHCAQVLEGFSTSDAPLAAEVYTKTYKKLSSS